MTFRTRVLIVDDSLPIRLALENTLFHLGVPKANIVLTRNADEAMEVFARVNPDIVFLDVELGPQGESPHGVASAAAQASSDQMPGEVLARRMFVANPLLKIVVTTGLEPSHPSVGRLIRSGAFYVLRKPIRAESVREVLKMVETDERGLERLDRQS